MATPHGSTETARRQKSDKSRRSWNEEEEEVLLGCLKELVATRWKSDNGFRPGYINRLAEMMRAHYPTANIKASPHITSKLTCWKKNYGSLQYILSRSGVGFTADFTVDCDNETWEQICNVDSNAKHIRGKSWPYYNRWVECFGKDRATGEGAEDVMEAVNELILEDNLNNGNNVHADASVGVEENPEDEETDNSVSNVARPNAGPSRGRKKRKITDNVDDKLCDMLGQLQKDTNMALESISERIGYHYDQAKARKQIFALLEEDPDLTLDEMFDACDMLADNPHRLDLFTSLPIAARSAYVRRLIQGKGK